MSHVVTKNASPENENVSPVSLKQTVTPISSRSNTSSYVAVFPVGSRGADALRLATALRKVGVPVDFYFRGKAPKLFRRARESGAREIVQVGEDKCRWWRGSGFKTIDATIAEIAQYHAWAEDDSDTVEDPPDRILIQNCIRDLSKAELDAQ